MWREARGLSVLVVAEGAQEPCFRIVSPFVNVLLQALLRRTDAGFEIGFR